MDTEEQSTEELTDAVPTELDSLKQRADIMGISYHPNIGLEKLKVKLAEKVEAPAVSTAAARAMAGEEVSTIEIAQRAEQAIKPVVGVKATAAMHKAMKRKAALRLVRVNISNMNPINGNLKSVVISVGNSEIGMHKRCIPFNTEQGWHVPQMILTALQNKKYMSHYETKVGNKRINKNKLVPEYSITVMPPLTAKELEALKQRQIIANQS